MGRSAYCERRVVLFPIPRPAASDVVWPGARPSHRPRARSPGCRCRWSRRRGAFWSHCDAAPPVNDSRSDMPSSDAFSTHLCGVFGGGLQCCESEAQAAAGLVVEGDQLLEHIVADDRAWVAAGVVLLQAIDNDRVERLVRDVVAQDG